MTNVTGKCVAEKCIARKCILGALSLGLVTYLSPAAAIAQTDIAFEQRVEIALGSPLGPLDLGQETLVITSEDGLTPLELGRQMYQTGQYSAAADTWQTAVESAQTDGDLPAQVIALSYVSLAYQALSQWPLAQAAIDQSVALLEQSSALISPLLWAQALNTQASLSYSLGQAESAIATWQQAEDHYQQAADAAGVLGSQINQAQALQSLGYYRRSRQQLEAIAQQLRTLPDSKLKINGFRSLGSALQVLGDLDGSRAALFESANIAVDINALDELSATYLTLGKAADDWGDSVAAIDMFERAYQEALTPADALRANLERLRFYTTDPTTAARSKANADRIRLIANEIADQLQSSLPSRLAVYATVNLSASLISEEQLGRSLPLAQHNQLLASAMQRARSLNDRQAEAYALNQWGALYMRTEQWSDALTLTQKSLEIARAIQADDISSQSAWQVGRILKAQDHTAEAIVAYSEAVEKLQSLRSDLVAVNLDVQFSFKENVEPIYRELVSLLLETQPSDDGSIAQPSQANLLQAREIIEALQLAELDNFFQEACIDVVSQQIDQVDVKATVIYPIILPDRLAVIASSPGQPLAYYATSVDAKTVEDTLRDLLSAIHPAADNARRLALSQQVYDWLVAPTDAGELTNQTETMVFVLDGLLRNVPMAALHDGSQYLIESYAVALSPGLQLMQSQSLAESKPSAVVGGISEARNGLSALPAVEAEIADISELIPADTLLNEEFTSDTLAKDIENSAASIVHLATHGQFSSNMEDTFLATWEGRLGVKELSEILQVRGQVNAIELLVLSACDTAAGDDRAALGLAGLAIRSGARATVATLWPVNDKAAARLMEAFYQGIGQTQMNKAEALRQAQLTLLADDSYSDPFFWSAYTLVGDWQ